MTAFKDTSGRTWTLALNVDALKRVRALCDVDLMDVVQDRGELLGRLSSDPVLLCDVIYAICKPDADAKGASDEDFGRAMAGDAVDQATNALLEALVDFFPGPRRAVLARVFKKLKAVQAKALVLANARLDDPELDAQIDREMKKMLEPTPGESSDDAPASSA